LAPTTTLTWFVKSRTTPPLEIVRPSTMPASRWIANASLHTEHPRTDDASGSVVPAVEAVGENPADCVRHAHQGVAYRYMLSSERRCAHYAWCTLLALDFDSRFHVLKHSGSFGLPPSSYVRAPVIPTTQPSYAARRHTQDSVHNSCCVRLLNGILFFTCALARIHLLPRLRGVTSYLQVNAHVNRQLPSNASLNAHVSL
jgi:hypothetical protein